MRTVGYFRGERVQVLGRAPAFVEQAWLDGITDREEGDVTASRTARKVTSTPTSATPSASTPTSCTQTRTGTSPQRAYLWETGPARNV